MYETMYNNSVTVQALAADKNTGHGEENDQNDVLEKAASCQASWRDYVYKYTGSLYSASKSFANSGIGNGISMLQYGVDVTNDVRFSMQGYGYNYDHYSMDLQDDAIYARAVIDGQYMPYTRLTEEDYEFTGVTSVTLSCSEIDRTNGQSITGVLPGSPFIVYGRKTLNGSWEEITRITMTRTTSTQYTLPNITGRGYVALRVETPKDLQSYFSVNVYAIVRFKASSPTFAAWEAEGDLTKITYYNFARFMIFETLDDGTSVWLNPATTPLSLAKTVGLADEDAAQNGGHHLYRMTGELYIERASESSSLYKQVMSGSPVIDVANAKVEVQFGIAARRGTSFMPEEFFKSQAWDDGVFYDLLPLGYRFNPLKGVKVYGANFGLNSDGTVWTGNKPAALSESVQTIENYKGTGCQLVIFRVESLLGINENYAYSASYPYTGFGIEYWTTASFDDVVSGETRYNTVAFQPGDGRDFPGGTYEHGGKSQYYQMMIRNILSR